MGQNKKNDQGFLGRIWLSCSLEQKVRYIAGSAAIVVILSIAANLLVAGFGMKGFHTVLKNNSHALSFWSAMSGESSAFVALVRDRTEENQKRFHEACLKSEAALEGLSFDYNKIGAVPYARTWSIYNMYENYARERDGFLDMEEDDEGYMDRLYTIYRVQGYLENHAGRLEQMTVEMGNESYERQRPLLIIVPVISVLWGAAALLMVRWLKQSVYRGIVRPVVELAEDSRRIGENDFSGPDIQAEGQDEIASLVRAFCTMKDSTKGYIQALTEKHEMEKQLDAVRLQMLKNQINPHFLFNTLNMIAGTAQIEDADTTEKMITALGRLFRYNLKSSDSVMPLERELKVVQDYMYLQKMRFGQRLTFTCDCHPDTLELLVPSFALQPLVENSIKYGISPRSQGGKIHIRSWLEGKRLWISVADTGLGMEEGRLKEIREALKAGDDRSAGVGLGNIYRRLHVMYKDGGMFLYSCKGCGTVVQMAFTGESLNGEGNLNGEENPNGKDEV